MSRRRIHPPGTTVSEREKISIALHRERGGTRRSVRMSADAIADFKLLQQDEVKRGAKAPSLTALLARLLSEERERRQIKR